SVDLEAVEAALPRVPVIVVAPRSPGAAAAFPSPAGDTREVRPVGLRGCDPADPPEPRVAAPPRAGFGRGRPVRQRARPDEAAREEADLTPVDRSGQRRRAEELRSVGGDERSVDPVPWAGRRAEAIPGGRRPVAQPGRPA